MGCVRKKKLGMISKILAWATQDVSFYNVEGYKRSKSERKNHEVSCVHGTWECLLDIQVEMHLGK